MSFACRTLLINGDTFAVCPYNTSHIMSVSRYVRHLVKCRESHAKKVHQEGGYVRIATCRYNYIHTMPEPELIGHESGCQSKFDVLPDPSVNYGDYCRRVASQEKKGSGGGQEGQPENHDSDEEEDWGVQCAREKEMKRKSEAEEKRKREA